MTFFGGVGGSSVVGGIRGGEWCGGGGGEASSAPSGRWFESKSSAASTRSGCSRYLRRNRETLPTSSGNSSFLIPCSLFTSVAGGESGGDLDRLASGERERSRVVQVSRCRKCSTSSSSASSLEKFLMLLFPMMLSMVKPEPLPVPLAVIGDRLLTAGSSVAVANAVGLGDLSPVKAVKGGKSGGSPVGGCGCGCGGGGGSGIGGRVGKPEVGGNGGPGGVVEGGKSGGAPSMGGGGGGGPWGWG